MSPWGDAPAARGTESPLTRSVAPGTVSPRPGCRSRPCHTSVGSGSGWRRRRATRSRERHTASAARPLPRSAERRRSGPRATPTIPDARGPTPRPSTRRTDFREYRETPGNLGVLGLRRVADGRAEFLLVTLWETEDSIRDFAGDEPEQAVFYPEDERFLVEADQSVAHYEIALRHFYES